MRRGAHSRTYPEETRLRRAALGLSHETNTFARLPATYERFAETGILRGEEIVRDFGESHATMAGYLDAGKQPDVEAVPLLFTHANPIGTITADAFDRIVGEMVDLLRSRGPWDGVLLALHGAAGSEQFPDADGEIAARVRALVGPSVPIGLAIDMHANISQKMVEDVTATVVYRSNPHLDPRPRARECADIIVRTIRGV